MKKNKSATILNIKRVLFKNNKNITVFISVEISLNNCYVARVYT